MNHQHESGQEHGSKYSFKDFYPLIGMFAIVFAVTFASQLYYGWDPYHAMRFFMGTFFITFGVLKVINLHGFAQAYATYDLIAGNYFWYGYLYPFLELGLGAAYLFNWQPVTTNLATLVLMLVSAAGVFNELRKGHKIVCACLGAVFKVPMTYVTLAEDLLMALMAFIMLLM